MALWPASLLMLSFVYVLSLSTILSSSSLQTIQWVLLFLSLCYFFQFSARGFRLVDKFVLLLVGYSTADAVVLGVEKRIELVSQVINVL